MKVSKNILRRAQENVVAWRRFELSFSTIHKSTAFNCFWLENLVLNPLPNAQKCGL